MIKTYKALVDFWHRHVLVPAGTLIDLVDAEVKYLRHAVELVEEKVETVVAEVKKPVEAVKAGVEAAKTVVKEDVKTDAKA